MRHATRVLSWIALLPLLFVARPAPASANLAGRFPSRFTHISMPVDGAVAVYTGDVNGDGWPDVLTRNTTVGNFSLLLGGPGGALTPFGTFTSAYQPTDAVLTRVDGDTRADLVIASYTTNTVTLQSGLASGGFGAPVTIATPSHPNAIACGDLNGDGRADLVVATFTETKVRTYLQQSDGSFALSSTTIAPASPVSVALADLDGNGKLDAIVVGSTSFRTYYGAGDGTYSSFNAFATGGDRALVGDFNHDGSADVAISDPLSVFLGDGAGGFQPKISLFGGQTSKLCAVGDWNGDGYDDLAVRQTTLNGSEIRVFGGGSPPSFPLVTVVPGPIEYKVAVGAAADFDGDGKLDLVTTGDRIGITVAHGNGNGTFGDGPAAEFPMVGGPLIELGDMNGDGRADVAALVSGSVYPFFTSPSGLPVQGATVPVAAIHVVLRDLDQDGRADIVALQDPINGSYYGALQVWLAQPDGSFSPQTSQPTATQYPATLAAGLVNADGAPDVVVAEMAEITPFLGQSNGALLRASSLQADGPYRIVLADLNGDGHAEAITQDNDRIIVYPGATTFVFEPGTTEIPGPALLNAVADLNGDGNIDILVWDATTLNFRLYPGDGSGNLGSPVTFTGSTTSNAIFADVDGDGKLDLIDHDDSYRLLTIVQGHDGFVFGPERVDLGLDAAGAPSVTDLNGDGLPDFVLAGEQKVQFMIQNSPLVTTDHRLPGRIALSATPNPARGPVSLAYSMPQSGWVRLAVFDLHGRLVRDLFSGTKPAGSYRESWDGRDASGVRAPAGVYFARGAFDGLKTVTKLVLMN